MFGGAGVARGGGKIAIADDVGDDEFTAHVHDNQQQIDEAGEAGVEHLCVANRSVLRHGSFLL
ncbi:hypothetical protein [Rugamonas sp. DEMB1]|uniref:hypothetical protein n=1 Tax=Rugamonas sp. DEMB1 TaxID=3039386 RepID=UPI002449111E|nr:hypothetical protein [Rugamonas sp. DEMB1]WGG53163.1 hypothetical protein QC826_14245 [Rugamonas sp. DEMB1]